jgi:hypothetical protein
MSLQLGRAQDGPARRPALLHLGQGAARLLQRADRPDRRDELSWLRALNFVVTGLLGEGVAASTVRTRRPRALANTCGPGTLTSPSGCSAGNPIIPNGPVASLYR